MNWAKSTQSRLAKMVGLVEWADIGTGRRIGGCERKQTSMMVPIAGKHRRLQFDKGREE